MSCSIPSRSVEAQGKRAAELIKAMPKTPVKVARVKGNQGEYGTGQYEKGQNEFLQPLINSGKVKVVCEQYTQNWDPTARAILRRGLPDAERRRRRRLHRHERWHHRRLGRRADQPGVQAGPEARHRRPGREVEALRYIAQGWQDNSVLKDLKIEANDAAEVVASILDGKGVPKALVNGKVNNQYMDVPAVFLPVTNITLDNLPDVVKAGRVDLGGHLQGHRDDRSLQEEQQVRPWPGGFRGCATGAARFLEETDHDRSRSARAPNPSHFHRYAADLHARHHQGLWLGQGLAQRVDRRSRGRDRRARRRQRRRQDDARESHGRRPRPRTPANTCSKARPSNIKSPSDATALGIQTVYQDLSLCYNLDAVQNLFLGRELDRFLLVGPSHPAGGM